MISTPTAVTRGSSASSYVCLSCRLKSTKRTVHHASVFEPANTLTTQRVVEQHGKALDALQTDNAVASQDAQVVGPRKISFHGAATTTASIAFSGNAALERKRLRLNRRELGWREASSLQRQQSVEILENETIRRVVMSRDGGRERHTTPTILQEHRPVPAWSQALLWKHTTEKAWKLKHCDGRSPVARRIRIERALEEIVSVEIRKQLRSPTRKQRGPPLQVRVEYATNAAWHDPKQVAPVEVRKQWGTPHSAKQQELTDTERLEAIEAVLDAHRSSALDASVDWAKVDDILQSARRREPSSSVYRLPSDEQEDDGVKERIVSRYAERNGRNHKSMGSSAEADPHGPSKDDKENGANIAFLGSIAAWKNDFEPQPSFCAAPSPGDLSHTAHQQRLWSGIKQKRLRFSSLPPGSPSTRQARPIHTFSRLSQQAAAAVAESHFSPPPPEDISSAFGEQVKAKKGIRDQLRQWQELHGNREEDTKNQVDFDRDPDMGETSNNLTRLPDAGMSMRSRDQQEEEERQALTHFMHSPTDDLDSPPTDSRFLKTGDLVELEFPRSERDSLIAVFVRRLGYYTQFFTMHGRWVHVPERTVQYSIPGWVSPSLVEPLLKYLPEPESQSEMDELRNLAYMEDLSVPREVAAPLVSRMVQFHTESQEIYRRYAGTLDNAHNILAHDSDLRYGSLLSAATTLLKMPADKLPVTALFTIRKALSHAGFAFNIDRRSHRLTGYLQIRSKEQVQMVEQVRNWLREWQDDMAINSALEADQQPKRRSSRGAHYVYSFLEKARNIVMKSRQNRDANAKYGNVGPSKQRFPITPDSDSVRVRADTQFTEQDTHLVRFIEAWACSNMYVGLPRIESLPPLLLQATGLYPDAELLPPTGFVFLQELGTIMPYENRVRFDQHLLLPSSQHSKPLQNLMASLMEMQHNIKFTDSMAQLRHDWGNMPVYCIDAASAHEIDDGLSIERAGTEEWWVHVHIANPTAFFERDHPLAKMARHMGESIYMPERTYMMLPRWVTTRHFSLGKDRPCLTFSAKLDGQGRTRDHKITSGIVRNVMRLTPDEVGKALQVDVDQQGQEIKMTVGGEPPPPRPRKSMLEFVTQAQVEELKVLQRLAEKRSDIRRAAGGVFFDMHHPDIAVWQQYNSSGLAWDHPHRKGARTVEGDPVIQLTTRGLRNWFSPQEDVVDVTVREMMLLACETAASWCAERQIPSIFRGTVRKPDQPDPDKYLKEVLEPAAQKMPRGEYPMHLGLAYIQALGSTALTTRPMPHKVLGLDCYGKVTSPLRRYGDMIVHWQIEAALREEAKRNKSLITQDRRADRSFLPFSNSVLSTIMLGLQPREFMIARSKAYAENFWTNMLLYRAFHYNECELPFSTAPGDGKPLSRVFISTDQMTNYFTLGCLNIDLNLQATMWRPERLGLEPTGRGDVWEVEVDFVDVYRRTMMFKPVRLVESPKWQVVSS